MNGLVTPRGLAFGPDGGLYVAEAGSGGNGPSVVLETAARLRWARPAALSRLLGGVQTRVSNGLPSVATAAGLDAGGLQDIVFDSGGQAFGLFSFGSDSQQRNTNLGAAGAALGTIARLSLDGSGSVVPVADIAAHEFAANPAGGSIDSNPFGLAIASNGNFRRRRRRRQRFSTSNGSRRRFHARRPAAEPNPLPFGPPVYQSVPTAITIGPDGEYYIGQLTGFPFPPGAANVYRFDPDTSAVTEAYTGFTNIIDLTFDAEGMLYVLQVSSNGLASPMGPGSGLLIEIDPTTGERTTIASAGLCFPGGVVAGPDGALLRHESQQHSHGRPSPAYRSSARADDARACRDRIRDRVIAASALSLTVALAVRLGVTTKSILAKCKRGNRHGPQHYTGMDCNSTVGDLPESAKTSAGRRTVATQFARRAFGRPAVAGSSDCQHARGHGRLQ